MSSSQQSNTSTSANPPASSNNGQSDSSQQARKRNKNKSNVITQSRYKGKCKDIEDYVYDLGLPNSNQDLYTVTTEAIAEYAAQNYDNAGEFRLGLQQLELMTLIKPDPPTDRTDVALMELYKLDLNVYHKDMKARKNNSDRIFALILGQCAPSVRNKIKADATWKNINTTSDCISLLKLVRQAMYQKSNTRDDTHKFFDAEMHFHTFRQTEKMTIGEYYQKFTGVVEMYEDAGGTPGVTEQRIKSYMKDPDANDADDQKQATEQARRRFLGLALLLKAFPPRYGDLVTDMSNNRIQGVDGYPEDLAKAYRMLLNCQPRFKPKKGGNDSGEGRSSHGEGLAFSQHSEQSGRGGRGGCGGRGGRGGRGTATRRGESESASVGEGNNLSHGESDYLVASPIVVAGTTETHDTSFIQGRQARLSERWLLLDSCSSIDMVIDKNLLTNITTTEPLRVHCNAGIAYIDRYGSLGTYPEKVWLHANGIANILSLANVSKHYRVTMDMTKANCLCLHLNNGEVMRFTPSDKGIYRYEIPTNQTIDDVFCNLQTVEENKKTFSKQSIKQAELAIRLQNIIMRPSSRFIKENVIKSPKNCPINASDLDTAEQVYGPNLGSIKGKTPRTTQPEGTDSVRAVPQQNLGNAPYGVNINGYFLHQQSSIHHYQITTIAVYHSRRVARLSNRHHNDQTPTK